MHAKAELLAELADLERLLAARLEKSQKQTLPIPTPSRSHVLPPTVESLDAGKCAGLGKTTRRWILLHLRFC